MKTGAKNKKSMLNMGVDIGGTKIDLGIVSSSGEIINMKRIVTGSKNGQKYILDNIINNVYSILEIANVSPKEINSIGFGIPGTIDSKRGMVEFAPNLKWKNFNFVSPILKELPFDIFLGQDTKAAVLGEYYYGAGKGCKNLVCVTIGTGIGGGIIINGKIYFGSYGTAGEIGHIIVGKNNVVCECGQTGCLETYASGTYIAAKARDIILNDKHSFGTIEDFKKDSLSAIEIFLLAKKGNFKAIEIVNEVVEYLGIGLVNIFNILCPEKIILSGGLSNEEELLIKPLKNFVKNKVYSLISDKIKIEKAKLGEFAPVVGASLFYKEKHFKYEGK